MIDYKRRAAGEKDEGERPSPIDDEPGEAPKPDLSEEPWPEEPIDDSPELQEDAGPFDSGQKDAANCLDQKKKSQPGRS